MIDTSVSVVVDVAAYRALSDLLANLPYLFRPKYFTVGHRVYNKERSMVDDIERYTHFINEKVSRTSVFDLIGERIQFGTYCGTSNRLREWTHVGCSVTLRGKKWTPDNFITLLKMLSDCPGLQFATAGRRDEWEFRHLNIKQFPQMSVQQSFGVDISCSLPGLYWWTVFSGELATRHGVDVVELVEFASHYETWNCSDGRKLHAFRMFDEPDDWKREKDRLSKYLETHSNFFSMTRIMPLIDAVETKEELDEVTRPFWAGTVPWT